MRRIALVALLVVLALVSGRPADARTRCPNGRSKQAAMWLSIAHPGLGEYFLKGWGSWSRMPQKKFWLGFIPLYGWPGYLQVKSTDDAFNCRTNDDLSYPPESAQP
jgi:hypothetical protein